MITKIENTQKKDILEIRWAISNMCNFQCNYCFPGSNEGDYPAPASLETIITNFNYLFDEYKKTHNKTKFDLKILGGEPTLWKHLPEFIKAIKQRHDVYISIISNGSRTIRWWNENGYLIDNLTLSYHQKFADLDHTIQVADIMYKLDKKITVHVLMDDQAWDDCVKSIEYMKIKSKYRWIIQTKEVVSTLRRKVLYSSEQRKYLQREIKRLPNLFWILKRLELLIKGVMRFKESIFTLSNGVRKKASPQYYLTTQQNFFKGWQCNLGIESLYIDYIGSIMGSCNQQFLPKKINILDKNFIEEFVVPINSVICEQQQCNCPRETHISKINLYL